MRVRGSLPGLLLSVSVTGCMHTVPCTPVVGAVPAAAQAPSVAVAPPPTPVVLLDVGWQLRSGEATAWSEVPLALHAFTVGRWECALGEVLPDDTLDADALALQRTRRLACTHATGATVQTQLSCTVHGDRVPSSKPIAPTSARELQLQLDATPTVHVRCAPAEVQELALLSRDRRPIAVMCARASGIEECTKVTRMETPTPVAPTPLTPTQQTVAPTQQ
jgi:hypothetical protein